MSEKYNNENTSDMSDASEISDIGLASNGYTIQISLNDATLEALHNAGMSLNAFHGVGTNEAQGARCTLWLNTNNLAENVDIEWQEQYGGYISEETESGGVIITTSDTQPMDLGDLMTVHDDGTAVIDSDGQPGAITIRNGGNKQWTCGMCQVVWGNMASYCAIPLFGFLSVLMEPSEIVLLVFEPGNFKVGDVVEETTASSIVITLTGDDTGAVKQVSFDINNGWSANGAAWGKINDAPVNIADTLIVQM